MRSVTPGTPPATRLTRRDGRRGRVHSTLHQTCRRRIDLEQKEITQPSPANAPRRCGSARFAPTLVRRSALPAAERPVGRSPFVDARRQRRDVRASYPLIVRAVERGHRALDDSGRTGRR
jgi:hypothetical protein